jgi:hypothetical protein
MGNPDPTSGATGSNVYGVNLNGDYDTSAVEGPYFVTPYGVSLAGAHSPQVRYQRWLNTEGMPHASAVVEASPDGSTWTTVWQNSGEITDDAWTSVSHSLAAVANGSNQVYVRFGYGIHDTGATPCSGWNLDDIAIWSVPEGTARISLQVNPGGLEWTEVPGAVAYDVVRGDLAILIATGGDFAAATEGCEAGDVPGTSAAFSLDPLPGDGYWFLVRGDSTEGPMSYQALYPSQVGLRDEEIVASGYDCP